MHISALPGLLCVVLFQVISARTVVENYEKHRASLIDEEATLAIGGNIFLTEYETIANEVLMKLKLEETEHWFRNPSNFSFSKHYFTYRDQIEDSPVYQIIRKMPKGAALHVHSSLILGPDFLLNMTYKDHLYGCYTADDELTLHFSLDVPERPCAVPWSLLSDIRSNVENVNDFDYNLKQRFTLFSDDEEDLNADINTVWRRFEKVYNSIKGLIMFRPVREVYFYEALKQFYEDNVLFIEIRSGLHKLYELNGTVHDGMYMARLYNDVTNRFIKRHPDFIGIKFILSTNRLAKIENIRNALDRARKMKEEMPDLFAGFDLVGQEDLGKPLHELLPVLEEVKNEMDFYFHGGETNWFGTSTDENLIDAILLGSKRIGHAYALIKHPILINRILKQNIALEINVISNAVLKLVQDVRNHPLASYFALGLPIVLSSDDPGVWGAPPLSHDFYVAFVAVASNHSNLRMLKQLALNSIKYSSLDEMRKENFTVVFNRRWDSFIKEIIDPYGNSTSIDSGMINITP